MTCKSVFVITSVALLGLIMTLPVAAEEVGVVSVVDEELGVVRARPLGWSEYPPRVYRRAPGTFDLTTFAQRRGIPGLSPDDAVALIPAYGASFEPAGRCETEGCVWELYVAKCDLWGRCPLVIEVAVTELVGTTHVTVLQASQQDYPALHEALMAPALAMLREASPRSPRQPEEPEDVAQLAAAPLSTR